MKAYKVSYWFNGKVGTPSNVVYLETDSTDRTEIKKLAAQKLGTLPRTYQVKVESAENAETFYVVKLTDSHKSDPDTWYHDRDGEMFVVSKFNGKYVTCHFLGNTMTTGYILPEFCSIVTTFKTEDHDW